MKSSISGGLSSEGGRHNSPSGPVCQSAEMWWSSKWNNSILAIHQLMVTFGCRSGLLIMPLTYLASISTTRLVTPDEHPDCSERAEQAIQLKLSLGIPAFYAREADRAKAVRIALAILPFLWQNEADHNDWGVYSEYNLSSEIVVQVLCETYTCRSSETELSQGRCSRRDAMSLNQWEILRSSHECFEGHKLNACGLKYMLDCIDQE